MDPLLTHPEQFLIKKYTVINLVKHANISEGIYCNLSSYNNGSTQVKYAKLLYSITTVINIINSNTQQQFFFQINIKPSLSIIFSEHVWQNP